MYEMTQFRVEKNHYGNMFIYLRLPGYLEQLVCLRQLNRKTNRYE